MIEGIIYLYESPSKKRYVGQTTNEKHRRLIFNNLNRSYGGDKINNARKKYLPENFKYTVLFKGVFSSYGLAKEKLDCLEQYYIKELDTYQNGYNSTLGGGGSVGFSPSPETREKLRIACTGWKQTEETKKRISQSHIGKECSANVLAVFKEHNNNTKKKIDVYTKDNAFIKTCDSILAASNEFAADRRNIYAVLKGRCKTTKGLIFKYNELEILEKK